MLRQVKKQNNLIPSLGAIRYTCALIVIAMGLSACLPSGSNPATKKDSNAAGNRDFGLIFIPRDGNQPNNDRGTTSNDTDGSVDDQRVTVSSDATDATAAGPPFLANTCPTDSPIVTENIEFTGQGVTPNSPECLNGLYSSDFVQYLPIHVPDNKTVKIRVEDTAETVTLRVFSANASCCHTPDSANAQMCQKCHYNKFATGKPVTMTFRPGDSIGSGNFVIGIFTSQQENFRVTVEYTN